MIKSFFRTALQVFLFFLLLVLLKPPFLPIVMVFLFLSFLLPAHQKLKFLPWIHLVALVLVGGIFFDFHHQSDRLAENLKSADIEHSSLELIAFRLAGVLLALFLVGFLSSRIKHSNPLIHFFKFFGLVAALVMGMIAFQKFPYINILLWISATVLAKYFWILLYSLRQTEGPDWHSKFLSIPFWSLVTNYHLHNVPRGIHEMKSRLVSSREHSATTAFRSMAIALLLALASSVVWDLVFSPDSWYRLQWMPKLTGLGHPSIFQIGIRSFNSLTLEWYHVWIISLAHGFCFLIKNASRMFVLVSLVQLCGFHVAAPVQQIHKARGFADFVGRYYYYYSDFIKNFFYYPILIYLDEFKMKNCLKKFLSAFLAVLVGGVSAHFMIELGHEMKPGSIANAAVYTLLFSPYLFLLAIFVGLSSCWRKNKNKLAVRNWIWFLAFIAIYGICFSLQFYLSSYRLGLEVNFQDWLSFLMSFAGLQGQF